MGVVPRYRRGVAVKIVANVGDNISADRGRRTIATMTAAEDPFDAIIMEHRKVSPFGYAATSPPHRERSDQQVHRWCPAARRKKCGGRCRKKQERSAIIELKAHGMIVHLPLPDINR